MLWLAALLLVSLLSATPALAEDSRSLVRQMIVMWLPLLVMVGLWCYFFRKGTGGKQAKMIERQIAMIDRYIPHMDAMEQKLDRIIERLDRLPKQ
jgi:hypothetical protein